MPTTKYFPFLMGLDQTTDDRLLEPGRPRAIENLAIRKKGRLGMRYDYDALAMTTQNGGTLTLHDLVSADGRLFGLGQIDVPSFAVFSPTSPNDVIEFEGRALFGWKGSDVLPFPTLSMVSYFRNIGRTGILGAITAKIDVAAGGGLVCVVVNNGATCLVHIIDAAKDATVLSISPTGLLFARVVCVGTKFFIGGVNGTTPKLFRYDPAVDTALTALPDPAAAGGAITAFDMSLANEGTTFWMGYCRVGPTTRIHGFDSNGTETHDFAGPAVLADFVTIYTEASLTATVRIHFACVINGTTAVNMSTYLGATSALQTNTPAMFAAAVGQVTMAITGLSTSGQILIARQVASDVTYTAFVNSSHALSGFVNGANNSRLNGKAITTRAHCFFPVAVTESADGSKTSFLVNATIASTGVEFQRAALVDSRGFTSLLDNGALPNWGLDVSTGRSYWARMTLSESGTLLPAIGEMVLASADRRQCASLGDCLYVAGGAITAFDTRSASEAGTLGVPLILTATPGGGGALNLLGTYQFVAVFEYFDARGRRVQSAPSEVKTATLAGVQQSVALAAIGPYGMRRFHLDLLLGYVSITGAPSIVFYRTLDTNGGNLTFFRDTSVAISANEMGATINTSSTQSDVALSANEILYTQGARGALSGPLPFLPPEPCSSLAASADRLLSGGLPETSRIQESRPLFVGEQVNWSNSLGFERDTKGRVLAVVRLDERRIAFTDTELFELDGPGLDDNGNGDIGAPRRLPSDVGLVGGVLGWRSIVECSLGVMFQGLTDQIYLLPRGGTTPQPVGMAVQDRLASFPTITAAVYMAADQTVRFTCNNTGGTDSIQLLYDVTQREWVTEGPFGVPTASAAQFQGRLCVLQSNVVRQQRASHPPAALIANAWRSGSIHPFGLGQFGRVLNYQFYGEYRGDCTLRCIATYDDQTVETLKPAEVNAFQYDTISNASNAFLATYVQVTPALAAGSPYSFKFTPNQQKCECVRVDFEVDFPFPSVVDARSAQQLTAANAVSVTLAANRAIGDRVIVVRQLSSSTATTATPVGWTNRSSITGTGGLFIVDERILDGSEVSPISFTWGGTATAAFVNVWTIRNSHPTAPIEVAASFVNGVSTIGALLTPSWGVKNTRWLSVIALDERPAAATNITQSPTGFGRGINAAQISADPNLSGQLEGGDIASAVASLRPDIWRWTDSVTGRTATIGIRPSDTLPSEGLAYHYWTMDVEDAGKSALKSPLQMG